MNLYSLARKFPTEDAALKHLIAARWPSGVRCLACDHDKCWETDSKGKTGKMRKLFQCAECGCQFSATQGTLFHDSHLPLTKWFAAIALMTEAKKGVSASQLGRHIGMTYKTAWYVCHRIREAMQEDTSFMVGGPDSTVEIDESYVGGRKRLHGHKAGHTNKTVVLGIAERRGKLFMQTLPANRREMIRGALTEHLDKETPTIITDGKSAYRNILPPEKHIEGNHKEELKTKNYVSTFTVENAFSLFKRGIVGSYHKLSEDHLNRYLGEFCWRYNRRDKQPIMFELALTNLVNKKPLPYKTLIYDGF